MGKRLKLCALFIAAALVFGCAAKQGSKSARIQALADELVIEGFSRETPHNAKAGSALVRYARTAIGTPYVRGGTEPGGFDCSGFVMWAYNNIGIELPRTAREQAAIGKKIRNVEDMRAGDIVAFNHPKRGYHTGIYVGEGKFIHSPRKRSRVKISSLSDPYFSSTLLGARRINMNNTESLVAQAETRLENYITQKSLKQLAERNSKAAASIKKSSSKLVAEKSSKKIEESKKDTNKKSKMKRAEKTEKKAISKKTGNKTTKTIKNKRTENREVSMLQQKSKKSASRSKDHS